MRERRTPLPHEHEETIAAFDRARAEAQELNRRHHEIIAKWRHNDRLVTPDDDDRDDR